MRLARYAKDISAISECSTDDENSSPDNIKKIKVTNRCVTIKAVSTTSVTSTNSSGSTHSPSNASSTESKLCAVKILSKQALMQAKQVDHVYNEMVLQQQLRHPFIVSNHLPHISFKVNMEGIQQDSRSLYIMMEYVEGGELFKVIQKMGHLDASMAKFYAAQIILVFEYLHSKNFVYRDLKPENVLVHTSGYLKVSDFGFLKTVKPSERTFTICGTPEYLAPEIIMNKGHGQPVDWYCLGIFIYELMVGRCPFMHDDPYEIFKMILFEKIRFPREFDR